MELSRRDLICRLIGAGVAVAASSMRAPMLVCTADQPAPIGVSSASEGVLFSRLSRTAKHGLSLANHSDHVRHCRRDLDELSEISNELAALADSSCASHDCLTANYARLARRIVCHDLYLGALGAETDGENNSPTEILRRFGDFDAYVGDILKRAEGSACWVFTVIDYCDGDIKNIATNNDGLAVEDTAPIFAIDLCEHAYFGDFGNDRSAYVRAALASTDWSIVARRYAIVNEQLKASRYRA